MYKRGFGLSEQSLFVVVVVVVLPSDVDSLHGKERGLVSCSPPPLTPKDPTSHLLRPAVPGEIAAFPLSRLCTIELRVGT